MQKIPIGKDIELSYREEDDMYCLTDLWQQAGSDESQKPVMWLRQYGTREYIKAIQKKLSQSDSKSLWFSKRGGRNPATYAKWMIALAYAQYLSPELHLTINEYFTRIYAGDVTLIEEIYNRASEEGKKFIEARIESKIQRRHFTDVLKTHDVKGIGYAACTNSIYEGVTGKNCAEIKQEMQLARKTNIRDFLPRNKILTIALAEEMSSNAIEDKNVRENIPCSQICHSVSSLLGEAVNGVLEKIKKI